MSALLNMRASELAVQTFRAGGHEALQREINAWLKANGSNVIKSIECVPTNDGYYAVVIYKTT